MSRWPSCSLSSPADGFEVFVKAVEGFQLKLECTAHFKNKLISRLLVGATYPVFLVGSGIHTSDAGRGDAMRAVKIGQTPQTGAADDIGDAYNAALCSDRSMNPTLVTAILLFWV